MRDFLRLNNTWEFLAKNDALTDLVEDTYNGFVFEYEDINTFGIQLKKIIQNHSQYSIIRRNARRTIEMEFNIHKSVEVFTNTLSSLTTNE